jgi:hypothetical protein
MNVTTALTEMLYFFITFFEGLFRMKESWKRLMLQTTTVNHGISSRLSLLKKTLFIAFLDLILMMPCLLSSAMGRISTTWMTQRGLQAKLGEQWMVLSHLPKARMTKIPDEDRNCNSSLRNL